jgi:hypothetical protein
MLALPQAAESLISSFRCAFTRPSFDRFVLLCVGAIVTCGRRTVSRILWTVRSVVDAHPSSYHRFLSAARWSLWPMGRVLAAAVLERVDASQPVLLAVDDTVLHHRGAKVYGKGCHRDAVRSTHSETVKKWGHKWVVVAVLVRLPFTKRHWALPILAALYCVPRVSAEQHRRHKTPCALARGLLATLLHWFPDRRFVVIGDGGFASHDLAGFCRRHHPHLTLIARMRRDANLYTQPAPVHPKTLQRWRRLRRKGLPLRRHHCRKGKKLPSPAATVAAASSRRALPCPSVQWYGPSRRCVQLFSACGNWFRRGGNHSGSLIPIRWVFVHDQASGRDDWFYSTDPSCCPQEIVERFAWRWSIEVTFEEARAHLGLETTRQRCQRSVLRTAPCLLGLFSLISLIFTRHCQNQRRTVGLVHQTPCYHKTEPTFADALYAVRRMMWDRSLLQHVLGPRRAAMLPIPLKQTLLTYLAEAA